MYDVSGIATRQAQSNATAEGGVELMKGKVRVLVAAYKALHGVRLGPTHPALPWAVQYSTQIINDFRWLIR